MMRRGMRGFGLVEVLVALVIGMLASLVILQMFAISEGQKRTTTGGSDAQTNAAVALYMVERELRVAGYGLAPNPEDFGFKPPAGIGSLAGGILAACKVVRAYNSQRSGRPNLVYADSTFAPVVISPPGFPAGDANTDVIMIAYSGSNGMVGNGVNVVNYGTTTQAGGSNIPDYQAVKSRAGFNQGDLIIAVPSNAAHDCVMGEVTGLPVKTGAGQCPTAITGDTNLINHNDVGSYENFYDNCKARAPAWNKSASDVAFNAGARIYNLGAVGSFVSRMYAVRDGNLTVCDLTANDCMAPVGHPHDPAIWNTVATGVLVLKAQYGKDTDLNGSVDTWDNAHPRGAERATVVAVRLALVVRSGQYEKAEVTTSAPVWQKDMANTSDVQIDVSGTGADWKHYRYKVAQTIVPLRNMLWGEQLSK